MRASRSIGRVCHSVNNELFCLGQALRTLFVRGLGFAFVFGENRLGFFLGSGPRGRVLRVPCLTQFLLSFIQAAQGMLLCLGDDVRRLFLGAGYGLVSILLGFPDSCYDLLVHGYPCRAEKRGVKKGVPFIVDKTSIYQSEP